MFSYLVYQFAIKHSICWFVKVNIKFNNNDHCYYRISSELKFFFIWIKFRHIIWIVSAMDSSDSSDDHSSSDAETEIDENDEQPMSEIEG